MDAKWLKKMNKVLLAAKVTSAIPVSRGLMSDFTFLFPIRKIEHARLMSEEKPGSLNLISRRICIATGIL